MAGQGYKDIAELGEITVIDAAREARSVLRVSDWGQRYGEQTIRSGTKETHCSTSCLALSLSGRI
jgi:hypothetical protein